MLPSSSAPVFVSRPAVRSAAVAMEVEAPKKSKGLGFVNGEMRAAAMKLHTRDQAPKEGQQPAQKPVSVWAPGRADYLRFLVDSREVYRCMDDLVATTPAYAPFRNSGSSASPRSTPTSRGSPPRASRRRRSASPAPTTSRCCAASRRAAPRSCATSTTSTLRTAGGLMIGKKMSDALLDGRTLEFYKWGDAGDVNPKEVRSPRRAARTLPARRRRPPARPHRRSAHARSALQERRRRCAPRSTRWRRGGRGGEGRVLDQTANSFRYSGALSYLRDPNAGK